MSYTIDNLYKVLKFTLKSEISNAGNLRLRTFVNNGVTAKKSYTPTRINAFTLAFNVPHSDYNVGDVITKFQLVFIGSVNMWHTQEGITILVDGEETSVERVESNAVVYEDGQPVMNNPCKTSKFALKFENTGEHTIQAVYRGNDSNKLSYTPQYHFQVTQENQETPVPTTDPDDPDDPALSGDYHLKIVNPMSTMEYKGGEVMYFQLTRGEVPIVGKTVEVYKPSGATGSIPTDGNGMVSLANHTFNAGKYTVGASFTLTGGKRTCQTFMDVTIKKGTPQITYTNGNISKNGTFKIYLKDNKGSPVANQKLTVFNNGLKSEKKTNSDGAISYTMKKVGKHTFKVVFAGSTNLSKKEWTFVKKVVN